jgi:hypothetical protein
MPWGTPQILRCSIAVNWLRFLKDLFAKAPDIR